MCLHGDAFPGLRGGRSKVESHNPKIIGMGTVPHNGEMGVPNIGGGDFFFCNTGVISANGSRHM